MNLRKKVVRKTMTTAKGATGRGSSSAKATASSSRRSNGRSSAPVLSDYETAVRWLSELTDYERMRLVVYNNRTFSLERMRRLLDKLDNPHQEFKSVHIAGTKGKGSTCAMLASMLQGCGYATGLYTSPHLVDLRERITINGQMISQNDLTEILQRVAEAVHRLDEPFTFFEVLTAAAFVYFAEQAVDIAVLETGLGGRLDATNVVTPLVCGLTHISLDHMNILGRELTSIAREKAGIMKKGVPAISVEQDPAVARIFEEVAQQVGAPLEFTGRQIDFSYRFEATRELGPHTRVSLITSTSRWEHLPVPLRGEHQAHNCALALAIIDKLKAHGFVFPDDKLIAGLARTSLPGRMEQIWNEPRVIIDGAHNAVSIQALIRSLGAHVSYDSLIVIFGCGMDKDINGMLKQLALGADKIIFTKARTNPRAMEPDDLAHRFTELSGKMAQVAPTLEEAIRLAARAVTRDDLLVITGSFYLVGEAKRYFANLATQTRRS